MPAFFEAGFFDPSNPELWVGVALLVFIAIVWMAGGFKAAMGGLDAKAAHIQSDLDEAARIRGEAEALLADINRQREDAELQAQAMLDGARDEAKRLTAEAKARLEETVAQVNAKGFGLTMGLHSRIARSAETVEALARVGNLYVNRSMIGAIVGSQPFGGEGRSGTGPKAGGPHYLPRFCAERVTSTDTTSSGGNATLLSLDDIGF